MDHSFLASFQNGSETLHMSSEGFGYMFEGEFSSTVFKIFPAYVNVGYWVITGASTPRSFVAHITPNDSNDMI